MCVGDQRSVMEPARPATTPRTVLNGISGAVRDPQFWRDVGGNASRAAQGLTSGVLGAPVDIASAAVRPFAQMAGHPLPPESVVGSSEWIGNKMGQDVNSMPWLAGGMMPLPAAAVGAARAIPVDLLTEILRRAPPTDIGAEIATRFSSRVLPDASRHMGIPDRVKAKPGDNELPMFLKRQAE